MTNLSARPSSPCVIFSPGQPGRSAKRFGQQPWILSFSYGRALQEPCIKAWSGSAEKINAAQEALFKRSKLNAAASNGKYDSTMEA